jgi:cytidylate kinase
MSLTHTVVAIDGPAASGKSSVARMLASRLGFVYVNTGAMYRAVTWCALAQPEPAFDPDALLALVNGTRFECSLVDGVESFLVNGVDPGEALNSAAVNARVSDVASVAAIRQFLVGMQREFGARHNVVMEGRDIGSVVFPETPYKFYIDASPEVREMRRRRQGYADRVAERDRQDSSRSASPLQIPAGADIIDSSDLTVGGTVDVLLEHLAKRGILPPTV